MEMSIIQIQYDTEKMRVLKQYMQDESELQKGMESLLQTLYEKYVPSEVREHIENQTGDDAI